MKSYQFDVEVANEYGVECAVVIWNFSYWIEHNEANGMHFHEGRTWTYNSVDALTKIFPFWTKAQIRRILERLENAGVLITGNFNQSTYDRTKWYAFGDSFQQMHLSKLANGSVETDNSNRDSISNEDIDIQIKNTDIADGELFQPEKPVVKRPKKTSEQLCLFAESRYADYDKFVAEFEGAEFKDVDLVYYYHAVADWSAGGGKKKKDWIATARNFIRSDMNEGRLHKVAKMGVALSPDAIEYLNQMGE